MFARRSALLQYSKALPRVMVGAISPRLNLASVLVTFATAHIHDEVGVSIALEADGPAVSHIGVF